MKSTRNHSNWSNRERKRYSTCGVQEHVKWKRRIIIDGNIDKIFIELEDALELAELDIPGRALVGAVRLLHNDDINSASEGVDWRRDGAHALRDEPAHCIHIW
jgi:hypothetical protein